MTGRNHIKISISCLPCSLWAHFLDLVSVPAQWDIVRGTSQLPACRECLLFWWKTLVWETKNEMRDIPSH